MFPKKLSCYRTAIALSNCATEFFASITLSLTILRTHLLVLTMNSLRLFSRALPKASLRQSAIRYSPSVSRFTARRPIWQPAMRTSYPAFSTSTFHREPAGDCKQNQFRPGNLSNPSIADLELAEKLNSERQLELENNDESTVAAIDDFLKTHPWEVQDKPGTHEVTLTREFGNEK